MVYIEREIEPEIEKWLTDREIIAIRGPRQSGKTTLLERIKEKLMNSGEKNIYFISFEDDIKRISFEENPIEFIKSYINEGRNFFLIDEVQYVNDVGKKLKIIFDNFNNVKIIMTGSSSFDLTNLGKYLVGRILFFDLLPFNFGEFLKSKGERYYKIYIENKIDPIKPHIKGSQFIEELNPFLKEYLTFGGYPRVVLESNSEKRKTILKNIFQTYIEKDVVSLYGKEYREPAVKILKVLAYSLGGIIKYEHLSQISGLKHNEIMKLLPLLEDSYAIKILRPFFSNLSNELRKNPKIYFIDYGIRNYLLSNFENISYDFLYENFLFNQLSAKYKIKYWRTTLKTEVDIIIDEKEKIPVESKTKEKHSKALRSFMGIYQSPHGIIANKVYLEKNNSVFLIPFIYF